MHIARIGAAVTVRDRDTGRTLLLTDLQAQVWERADGRRSFAEIAAALRRNGHTAASEETVVLALDALAEAGLLENDAATPVSAAVTRRGLIDRAWRALVAAMLLPLAAHSALADDDDEDDDDEDNEDDEGDDEGDDDTGGAGGGSDGSGTGSGAGV